MARQPQALKRRKLLALLPRSKLEELSGLERPWHANRPDLIDKIVAAWPHDEIEDEIKRLLESAK